MYKRIGMLLALFLVLVPATAVAEEGKEISRAEKRTKIDGVASEALEELFQKSDGAKSLYDKAYGYAVFDNLKISFGISGGGGSGVAVAKDSGTRTYMKMGTGGIGLGLGGKKYQVIFFFETKKAFDKFVDVGWQAGAEAHAAAGTAGAGVGATFHDGIALYQLTEKGLVAAADISGTKYWKNKKLNE